MADLNREGADETGGNNREVRAFAKLKERSMSQNNAFSSAVDVFRFYHPEIPPLEAVDTADLWLLP